MKKNLWIAAGLLAFSGLGTARAQVPSTMAVQGVNFPTSTVSGSAAILLNGSAIYQTAFSTSTDTNGVFNLLLAGLSSATFSQNGSYSIQFYVSGTTTTLPISVVPFAYRAAYSDNAAGTSGAAVLAATQTFTGQNTFTSSMTITGADSGSGDGLYLNSGLLVNAGSVTLNAGGLAGAGSQQPLLLTGSDWDFYGATIFQFNSNDPDVSPAILMGTNTATEVVNGEGPNESTIQWAVEASTAFLVIGNENATGITVNMQNGNIGVGTSDPENVYVENVHGTMNVTSSASFSATGANLTSVYVASSIVVAAGQGSTPSSIIGSTFTGSAYGMYNAVTLLGSSITAVNTSSLTITGISLSTGSYELIANYVWTGTNVSCYLWVNGDYTQTDYYQSFAHGTTIVYQNNAAAFGMNSMDTMGHLGITLSPRGYFVMDGYFNQFATTSVSPYNVTLYKAAPLTGPITKIELDCLTNNIGAHSSLSLYQYH